MTLLLFSSVVIAQIKSVSGRVADENGNPVSFASIKIKGTKKGETADDNGAFKIQVQQGATLIISASGYGTKEVEVGDKNILIVSLERKQGQLTEVVVTALGVKRQPRELGYATTKVSAQELTQAKVTNLSTGLAAKVSGLQINLINNGVVGTNTRVTLRGNRSITGNNQALMVVDDIPVSIDFINSVNPNDVENVTILKGASASALYGSAASNGVIIVNTKKGTRGKPQIKVSNTTTIESVAYMPDFQSRFGGYGGEAEPYDQSRGIANYVPYENQSYGPEYNGQLVDLGGPVRIYRPDGTFFDSTLKIPYSAIPNAKRNFFNKGITSQSDLSYATGDDKSRFYMSFQNVVTRGVVPKDKNQRNSFRINGSRENGIFRVDYGVGYTVTNTDITSDGGVRTFNFGGTRLGSGVFGIGGAYEPQQRPVYWSVINQPAHIDLRQFRDWKNNPFANPNGYVNAYYGNPWWQIDESRSKAKSNDILANLTLSLKPASWMNVSYRLGFIRNDYSLKSTKSAFTFESWAIADPLQAGTIPATVKDLKATFGESVGFTQRLIGDFLISANKEIGDFTGKILLGNTLQKNSSKISTQVGGSLVVPDLYNITNIVGQPIAFENTVETGLIGAFADFTLGWRNYLFLHASARNDWDSRLSKENRSFFYPSVDASFVFTDAINTFKNSKVISYGKLRAAFSKVGQVNLQPYSLENVFFPGIGFPYGNIAGYVQSPVLNNPDIKPEFTTEKEIGLELGFFNNRINLQAAVFNTKSVNQTIQINISGASGYNLANLNTGEMVNKGFELDLKVTPVLKTKNGFKWDIGGNFTYINNKVVSIYPGLNEVAVGNGAFAIVGSAYPAVKANDWKRDAEGHVIVDRSTGFPTLDPTLKSYGTANWPYKIGLNTSISFKGFTLTAVADGRFGAVINNAVGNNLDFTGISAHSAQTGRQNFVFPNSVVDDGTGKLIANTNISTVDANYRFWANTYNNAGSVYVNSSDFWKLRELTVSYDFPKSVIEKIKWIKALNVSLIGRNLFTWKAKDNVWTDPEFSVDNGNGTGLTNILQTPPTRLYGASVNITF